MIVDRPQEELPGAVSFYGPARLLLTGDALSALLSIPSEMFCPRPNFATAPRAKPTAIADIKSRTFLAALLPIIDGLASPRVRSFLAQSSIGSLPNQSGVQCFGSDPYRDADPWF
jgi:hypothetical protein